MGIGENGIVETKEENEHLLSVSSVVRIGGRPFKHYFSINYLALLGRYYSPQGPIANNCQKPCQITLVLRSWRKLSKVCYLRLLFLAGTIQSLLQERFGLALRKNFSGGLSNRS